MLKPITEVWALIPPELPLQWPTQLFRERSTAESIVSEHHRVGILSVVQRLPIATPEMVEFMNAARNFVHAQRRSGFGTNAMMPHWYRLEAAEQQCHAPAMHDEHRDDQRRALACAQSDLQDARSEIAHLKSVGRELERLLQAAEDELVRVRMMSSKELAELRKRRAAARQILRGATKQERGVHG